MGGTKRLNKYDEYWVVRNYCMGHSLEDIEYSLGYNNRKYKIGSINNVNHTYVIVSKYKLYQKKKYRSHKINYFDDYFIVRSFLSGYNTREIAEIFGVSGFTITNILRANNYWKEKTIHYGITEIAKELVISKQTVHQKVKMCQSPYIKYKRGRNKKVKTLLNKEVKI